MFQKRRQVSRWTGATIAVALLFASGSPEASAGGDNPLRVRVSDAIGTPGGLVVFVLRTYAPRPITQGQVFLKIRRTGSSTGADVVPPPPSGVVLPPPSGVVLPPPSGVVLPPPSGVVPPPSGVVLEPTSGGGLRPPAGLGRQAKSGGGLQPPSVATPRAMSFAPNTPLTDGGAESPLDAFVGSQAFSAVGDATSATSLTETNAEQTVSILVSSVSGTINEAAGPLAAMAFRLSGAVLPQEEFTISLDPNLSFFVDSDGKPVTVDPLDGMLTVRAPEDPLRVEVEDDDVAPGETATIGLETSEPAGVSSGQVGFRFDPNIAAGPAVVALDARHGQSVFFVDQSTPGLVLVSFWSPDNSLNLVPGVIVSFDLPTALIVPPGSRFPISLDPSLTFLLQATGILLQPLPLDLTNGELVFR